MPRNLDNILAGVADGIVALDNDLRYVFANDAAERLVGVSRAMVLGRTPMEVFPPEVTAAVLPYIRDAIASGRPVRYEAHEPVSGRWFENRLSPSADGITIIFTDITARKQAEEALRKSEEGHRLLVSLNDAVRSTRDADDVMWRVVTRAGRHFRVNRCTYGEIDARQQHVIVGRDYVDGVGSVAGRHRLDDFGVELVADLKRGHTVTVPDVDSDPRTSGVARAAFAAIEARALICVPLVKEGRFVALFVLHHATPRAWTPDDVLLTEQIAERTWFAVESARAEQALAVAREAADADAERLNLALQAARLGDWSWDAATDVVTVSPRAAEIFGIAAGSVMTSTEMRALLHPDDREATRIAAERATATRGPYLVECRLLNGGRERWVIASGRARYEGDRPIGMFGVVQEITSDRLLVRLDDQVRAMSGAQEIISTAARILGEHLDVGRCAYATVEADEDTFELSGNYTRGTHSIVGRYRFRQFGADCLRLMRAGEPFVVSDSRTDTRLHDADRAAYEQTAIRAVICVPIHKSGRFVAAMAVHALTPRNWVAAEVELVQRVASRCWESLERARVERERADLLEAAETANRAKDEFLAMLGHELRNPLSPILTALQLMKLRGDESSLRERIVIERQVVHLTRLVDDLLDVSRIARGKVELKRETLEIAEVVARAIEVASPLLEQRTQTMVIDVPTTGLPVDGDPARLTQIVSNLLNNASKYTPAGGHIDVIAAEQRGQVVLRVRDNGVGIPVAVLPHVFDLFVQGGQPIDRAAGGLGLGLTIARSLTERHGGTIAAHSDGPSRGSEFTVYLPCAARPEAPVPADVASGPAKPAASAAASVLIVDDNADAAEMLAEALVLNGHRTWVAHDGPTALGLLEQATPNVALLDIGLPVMDGYELAGRLRQTPGLENIRLVAITGYGQTSDRERSAAAGFHHHLVKPIKLDEVTAVLESLVGEDPLSN